jgi:seryl-tRNA synthetase
MLDIQLIRERPEAVKQALLKRMDQVDLSELLAWDQERRSLIQETEALKAERNQISTEIGRLRREGGQPPEEVIARMQDVGARIKSLDGLLGSLESQIQQVLVGLPNIPDEDVPPGGKENNTVIRQWGQKPDFDFEPKDHFELVTRLKLVDFERGVKLGGNGFWLYRGYGARLEWALLNYFIQEHLKDGYELILPPHILTYESGYAAGQFPKFEGDVFLLEQSESKSYRQFLLPTAETALINFHRTEILAEDELPKKYFAYTPCYRKEAGSYRASERGTVRGHQFNKVELFQFTHPTQSEQGLAELLDKGERLMQGLGLHYQVSKLAARDASAAMAKTYDIEVWIPSMNEYKEVSSASNARDYQARRGMIRYKTKESGKNHYVHTLNASGLATSRLLPALVEQFQQADGSVIVPEILRSWVGVEVIRPE